MKFTKMHGLGNDYVYVNCLKEQVEHPEEVARRISDRHFGIGSDGLILIRPSETADFEMEMYNADGSRGAMCGNGIRCVAKYVYEYGLTDQTTLCIATGSGNRRLDLTVEDGKVTQVRVDMGSPILDAKRIPVCLEADGVEASEEGKETERVISRAIRVGEHSYRMTCVSMGNPHCVVRVEDVEQFPLEQEGPRFEWHPAFPERVNTEFIRILDRSTIEMRVWERGSGETMACGTGACASVVAGILNGWTENAVTVRLRGGELLVEWDRETNTVFMTGPATVVFDGEIEL